MFAHLYTIPITEEEAIKHFQYLREAHIGDYLVEKKENQETSTRIGVSTNGGKASNYFFQSVRLQTNYRGKGSYDKWIEVNTVERLQSLALAYSKKKSIDELKPHDLQSVLHLRVGTINQFKPRVAACLYNLFKPSSIIDFSSGWGDRCVAALAKGINYIGIDTNLSLQTPYDKMIDFYKQFLASASSHVPDVQIHFQPSETFDFSAVKYDMVFTSPPYFDLESYEHMPKYEGYEHWVQTFLLPVVTNSWTNLQPNGWMCLNIPSNRFDSRKFTKYDLYNSVFNILGEPTQQIQMMLQQRVKDNDNNHNCEYIYCWQKVESSECKISLSEPVSCLSPDVQLSTSFSDQNELTVLRDELRKLKTENQALKNLLKIYL
jgi:hypothetical protein